MDIESSLSGQNLAFLEALYEAYQRDPNSIDPQWIPVIEDLERRTSGVHQVDATATTAEAEQVSAQAQVDRLIEQYRLHGHKAAKLDPLGRPRPKVRDLDPAYLGLGEEHMDRHFDPGNLMPGKSATLRQIYQRLQNTYCRHIGVEYWHLRDTDQRTWLQARMEGCENRVIPKLPEQKRLLSELTEVETVDQFLHSKFLGAKRFSIAGAESMIAALYSLIEEAGSLGVDEVVLGMAHRGRLNVLMTIMGKTAADMFSLFQKADPWEGLGSGDVKYHMGYYRNYKTESGREMYLALAFNPSHLEAISPVVQGRVRAKQDMFDSIEQARSSVMGVTLHGDAAFAGQGVVQETLNLMALRGYNTGGTIRIVINNQVGFTTNPSDSRSTRYATDVAHMLQVPIFHINGDDAEAAAYVARLAVAFRQRFKRDVIIDLNCYRKFGHNEGDDPTFTQPEMYRLIKAHESVLTQYRKTLIERGSVTQADCDEMTKMWSERFDSALAKAREAGGSTGRRPMHGVWKDYRGGLESETPDVPTNISQQTVDKLAKVLCNPPEGFNTHRKVKRLLGDAEKMYNAEAPLSWAAGELLTYSSLLDEGVRIRFSGQDSQRGTFSHRHAVWFDNKTGEGYSPLDHLHKEQGRFEIFNSPLSEYAVLGFEFGYSLMAPDALVVWEAQFGDFANGAQIIIDNFLSASEDKWNRLSGLVMMLPHGFEGQGPEHSSARLERFLQLAAEDNIQVCNLTSTAQLFHVLRRQVLRRWRKPLILMSPKSLLRFRPSFSPLSEFTEGSFRRLIDDSEADPQKVTRVLLSAGKVYYDLLKAREDLPEGQRAQVALVRLEQLYPFPGRLLASALARYTNAHDLVWVQEEPRNQGAWSFVAPRIEDVTTDNLGRARYVGRVDSASPATGSPESHALELKLLLEAAFANLSASAD